MTDNPAITNLEAQRRCQAVFQRFAADEDDPARRLFFQAMVRACQIDIDGILRTGNDDYVPF